MRTLKVFIDESGTYRNTGDGEIIVNDRFYAISLVFYEDDDSNLQLIRNLNEHLKVVGYKESIKVHCMPLINRDDQFSKTFLPENVRYIFGAMNFYLRKMPIKHITILLDNLKTDRSFNSYFETEIQKVLNNNAAFFKQYDQIALYYDNGQIIVKQIVKNSFDATGISVEFIPIGIQEDDKYRLYEMCDYLCSMTLSGYRLENSCSTKAEKSLFGHSYRDFRKTYLSAIEKTKLK